MSQAGTGHNPQQDTHSVAHRHNRPHEQDYVQRYPTVDIILDIQGCPVNLTKIADFEALLAEMNPVTFAADERLPYWSELWPSAIALAHYITQHLALAGQQVLELGCGLGLVGVVAALHGARVLCTDYEAAALAFTRHNARRNACHHMHLRLVDWRQPALRRRYTYILASDVIYEARNFGPLVGVLQRYLARHGVAVFSEPGRVNAVPFFSLLRQRGFRYEHVIQPVVWDGAQQIHIYSIRHQGRTGGEGGERERGGEHGRASNGAEASG